jgi:hypothetical protein
MPAMRVFPGLTGAAASPTTRGGIQGVRIMSKDRAFYERQAEDELRLAARADSSELRKIHLDRAASFSTMAERADDRQPAPQA